MALTLRPDDTHYGLEGDYKYCLQYFLDSVKQKMCEDVNIAFSDVCFGERKIVGSESYGQCSEPGQIIRRLTSNPQFEGLTGFMDGFIRRNIDR